MGKGSGRRPTDDKKFVDNFDRIFNNKKNVEWEDEIITEEHNESLKEKDDGSITNPANAKKTKG